MKHHLVVTYRRGRPLAAYLHLSSPRGARAVRTEQAGPDLMVDFSADGVPIGVEIVSPRAVTVAAVNEVLSRLGFDLVSKDDLAPLQAA